MPNKFGTLTPRQHRAAAAKGGRSRMKKVTREQQREWGRLGGLRNQARLREHRARLEAEANALLKEQS